MNTPIASILLFVSMALPTQAAELIDRQLKWFKAHDKQEITLPDGSIAVPFIATSSIWWLEPDRSSRDVGRISRDMTRNELVIEWAEHGRLYISSDPSNSDLPYKPTGRSSALATNLAAILNTKLVSSLGPLPPASVIERAGTVRVPTKSGDSEIGGSWQLLGDALRVQMNDGAIHIVPIAEILTATQTP
jgi:hypothetical protein